MARPPKTTSASPRELALRAVGAWGPFSQLDMVQEECAELIAAINWARRNRSGLEQLAAEIADVEIVLESARVIVGDDLVDRKKAEKLFRLETTLQLHEMSQEQTGEAG